MTNSPRGLNTNLDHINSQDQGKDLMDLAREKAKTDQNVKQFQKLWNLIANEKTYPKDTSNFNNEKITGSYEQKNAKGTDMNYEYALSSSDNQLTIIINTSIRNVDLARYFKEGTPDKIDKNYIHIVFDKTSKLYVKSRNLVNYRKKSTSGMMPADDGAVRLNAQDSLEFMQNVTEKLNERIKDQRKNSLNKIKRFTQNEVDDADQNLDLQIKGLA